MKSLTNGHTRLFIILFFCIFLAPFGVYSNTTNTHATKQILVFGDSISAGYGLRQGESWTALLQTRLDKKRYAYTVVNASLSGETTLGGKNRLEKALKQHQPDIVIIELGGNDGLRGFNLKNIQSNLAQMIELSQQKNHRVLLVGMQLPPNYGSKYTKQFSSIYQTLAMEKNTALVPFLFKGIANNRQFFQADGIHPNADAQHYLLDNVWEALKPMLSR